MRKKFNTQNSHNMPNIIKIRVQPIVKLRISFLFRQWATMGNTKVKKPKAKEAGKEVCKVEA